MSGAQKQQRPTLPPYPKQPRSDMAVGRSRSTLRQLEGFLATQQALVAELDAALAEGLQRADQQRDTRQRVIDLAKQARGQRR